MKLTRQKLRKIILFEIKQLSETYHVPQPPDEIESAFAQYDQPGLDHKYDIIGLKNDPDVLNVDPIMKQLFSTDNIEHANQAINFLEMLAPELLERHKQESSTSSGGGFDTDDILASLPPDIPGWDDMGSR